MCALIGNAFYTPPDFPYLVQRIFSNAAAPTGRSNAGWRNHRSWASSTPPPTCWRNW